MMDIFNNEVILQDMENIYSRKLPVEQLFHKSILISGATGMLASYFCYYLFWLNEVKQAGITILVLVRSQEKCQKVFGEYAHRDYFHIYTDSLAKEMNIAEPVDYIVHAASLASPQYYKNNPVEVALPNTVGTYHLLELAREKEVKGFLYFSSGDVYGKMPEGIGAFSENQIGIMDPLDEHSCYGGSKSMGEIWCASYAREYHVPAKMVRIGHTYAPTMDVDKDPRVFASFMKCLLENRDIVMLSDGTAKRPFCYIADAIAAYLLILLEGANGEAYNMANEDEFLSIAELADKLVSLDPGKKLKVICKKRTKDDVYMENDSNQQNLPSSEKLKKLGWSCQYDVRKGFGQVLRFLQSNEVETYKQ